MRGAPRPNRVPLPAALLLGAAATLGGYAAWPRADGVPVDATVVADLGGSCRMAWTDPASHARREAVLGCAASARAGERVRVVVDAPAAGPARTVAAAAAAASGTAGLVAVGTAARRRGAARARGRAAPLAAPELPEGPVSWAAASAVATARAAAEGWAPPASADPGPAPSPPRAWWRVPALRRAVAAGGSAAVPALVAGAAAVAAGGGSWLAVWTLATADDRAIYARVVDVDRSRPPWLTYATRVHFHPGGRQLYATVPTTREFAIDERVAIIYSPEHPGRARLDEPGNGLRRHAGLTGAAAAGCAGFVVVRVGRAVLTARRMVRLRAEEARSWRYVRFVGPGGGAGLLLWPRFGDGPPEAVVGLAAVPGASAAPVAGEAMVHGDVRRGGVLVPVVGGHPLWPAGRARAAPEALARRLIEGR